jgi:hypothetical protein
MDNAVDPQLPSLFDLRRIWIYPDQVARTDLFQNDAGQQPIAAPKIEPSARRKTVRRHLGDLDRTPERSGRLERILLKESNQQLSVQGKSPSSCSS